MQQILIFLDLHIELVSLRIIILCYNQGCFHYLYAWSGFLISLHTVLLLTENVLSTEAVLSRKQKINSAIQQRNSAMQECENRFFETNADRKKFLMWAGNRGKNYLQTQILPGKKCKRAVKKKFVSGI